MGNTSTGRAWPKIVSRETSRVLHKYHICKDNRDMLKKLLDNDEGIRST